MNRKLQMLLVMALANVLMVGLMPSATMASGASSAAGVGQPSEAGLGPDHVIHLDLDGFDERYFDWADTPNIDALVDRGSFTSAEGVVKSFSTPSRGSVITGAWPEVHGNEAWYYDDDLDMALRTQVRPRRIDEPPEDGGGLGRGWEAETMGEAMRAEGLNMATAQYTPHWNHGTQFGDPEGLHTEGLDDCEARTNVLIDIIHQRPVESGGEMVTVPRVPDYMAMWCLDIDDVGHDEGPYSDNIPPTVEEVDGHVGRIVQATKDAGIYGETAFVVNTDHSMQYFEQPALPDFLDELDDTGFVWEEPENGEPAQDDTEVILITTSRGVDITLRGDAATDEGREQVEDAIRNVGEDKVVLHDADNLEEFHASDRMGDLYVEAVEPYHMSSNVDRDPGGGHGGANEKDGFLVMSGAGIRTGVEPEDARLIDIAPTINALLGIRPPEDAQGRVLDEALLPGVGADPVGLEVTPAESTIGIGGVVQLDATATFDDDSEVEVTGEVEWVSDNEDIASVDDEGLVTGQADGATNVTASLGDLSDSASVTVDPEIEPGPEGLVRISAPPGRIEVAIAASQHRFDDGEASAVVLARADEYPDALAGTTLAAEHDAPLLLTSSDVLLDHVADEISRVLGADGQVYLTGGTEALDETVQESVDDLDYDTMRLGGQTRFETAGLIASELGKRDQALVTTGLDFPDALTAGAAAAANDGVVLLSAGDEPHDVVDEYLDGFEGEQVWAIGGPATRAYPDAEGVMGETRDETAVAVAEALFDEPVAFGVARRDDYPDALAGGAHIAAYGGPLLLTYTDDVPEETAEWLVDTSATGGFVYGGTEAISEDAFDELDDLAFGDDNNDNDE